MRMTLEYIMSRARQLLMFAALVLGVGCNLDVENPNALEEDAVLRDDQGMLALVVGMQDLFAENVEEFVQGSALTTDEWGTGTRSLSSYRALLTGEAIDPELGVIEEPWSSAYRVVNAADQVIANAPSSGLDAGTVTGITAIARLFRGMSLGILTTQFDQAVLNPAAESPELRHRDEVRNEALAALERARAEVQQLTAQDLAFLRSRVLGAGLDLPNTVDAMLARYYLFDGQYEEAIAAAERVDLTVRSQLPYTPPDVNPICNLSECGLQYVYPLASFADQAEEGDQRVPYWVDVDAARFTGTPDSLLIAMGQYSERTDPFLVYVPDEMTLIRAESHARLGNLDTARDLINQVRTRSTIAPVAGLPPLSEMELSTQDDILRQILYERRYELFQQGLRWPDLRRLSEYSRTEPTINFFPIPQDECRTNPALGC